MVDYGVVPFENSSNGSVIQTLDLLIDRENRYPDIRVCDEHYFTVHHCLLLSTDGESRNLALKEKLRTIEKIYTHPQVWGQCEAFLTRYFKGVERQDVSSTSKAAQMVREESTGRTAAIASRLAGHANNLHVASQNIEDRADNTTRFFILKKFSSEKGSRNSDSSVTEETKNKTRKGPAKWKSLILFTIDHAVPGALADALNVFKQNKLNLTSIDTRPSRQMPWHYVFFVECQESRFVDIDDQNILSAISSLQKLTQGCKHLGSWKEHQQQATQD